MKPFINRHPRWSGRWIFAIVALLGIVSGATQAADNSTSSLTLTTVSALDASMRPQGVPADYVVTPNGYFSASCVQVVHAGEKLHSDGRIEAVNGTMRTPAICTQPHYSASGVRVDPNGMTAAAVRGAHKNPTINGWVLDADYSSSVAIGRIVASWTVPSAPTRVTSSQVDYFFPGLEQSESSAESILQPVLGYNAFSSPYNKWTMASWNCCVSGTTYYSDPINVSVGDKIVGNTQSSCGAWPSCATWAITSTDETTGQSTTLNTDPYAALTWVFGGVLEAYGISSCTQFPASQPLVFSNIQVYDINNNLVASPPWGASYDVGSTRPQCNYKISTTSGSVTLAY